MPTDIVNYYFQSYATGKVEVYKSDKTLAVKLEFHPKLGYTWHTDDVSERKTIKKAITRFLGYEPVLEPVNPA